MPDIPLDIDVDALDDWAVHSQVALSTDDLLVLFDTFDQWLARGRQLQAIADPYAFVALTCEYYLRVAEQILGEGHPFVQYLRREGLPKVKPYVDKTRMLLRDWSERWGERWEMSPTQLDFDLCLRNVVATDTARRMRLALMEGILVALETGAWSEEGLTPIAYELGNGARGTVELPSLVVSELLDRSETANSKTVFEARADERTPWSYLFIEPVDEYGDWLGSEGLDIIHRLWQDDLGLSPQAKQEMEQLGWLILEKYVAHFTALTFLDATHPGVILVPAYESWMREGVYTEEFKDRIVSRFEHETQHLVDWRLADGAPLSSTIAETRAWSAQLDTMRRVGSSPEYFRRIESVFLKPYLAAIRGAPVEFGAFHDEDPYYSRCCMLLPVIEWLEIVEHFVDVLRADE